MEQGRIVIVTGSPGTGKSTVSALLAEASSLAWSVHMHTDDFYHYLSKGAAAPHLPGADRHNRGVIEALSAAAERFARGGYETVVDGIVGPWFLSPWRKLARAGCEVHYIVLRASREETLRRALARAKLSRTVNTELVDTMWAQFLGLGEWERNVLDTTDLSVRETVAAVQARIADGTALLA